MRPTSIPQSLCELLIEIQQTDPQILLNLRDKISNINSVVFPEDFEEIAVSVGVPEQVVSPLILHLSVISEYFDGDLKEKDNVDLFLKLAREFDDGEGNKLSENTSKAFADLAFGEDIYQINKIGELAYNHPDRLTESNIIVDARPLFEKDHSNISTYIILSFLRLKLSRHSEPELLNIHLDRDDIEELKKTCERALNKMDKVAKQLFDTTDKPVYLPGVKGRTEL